jgi:hypothetical protein
MKMLGRRTHQLTLECPYGCCQNPLQYSRKGRKALKRSIRRKEKTQTRKDIDKETV